MAKRRLKAIITDRDIAIFRALWRWKLLTTSAVGVRFFPGATVHTAYRRLFALAKQGYIQNVLIQSKWQECWCLNKKGFQLIKESLGSLQSEGYRSEHQYHDHLVTAFHLGEWWTHQPQFTKVFSEQQLRCIHADLWDEWVPQSDRHRSDGYTLTFNGDVGEVTSFEVELNVKMPNAYAKLVLFYDSQVNITKVLWLVETSRTAIRILKALRGNDLKCPSKHQFILLKDFQASGWNAKVHSGTLSGKSIYEILPQAHSQATPSPSFSTSLALLNLFKKPAVSKA